MNLTSETLFHRIENKDVSPTKGTTPLSREVVSQNNSLSKLKIPSHTENKVLLRNQTLNTKI